MEDFIKSAVGIFIGIVVVLTLILGFSTCKIISPGERGVKVTLGKISPEVYDEGMHFITPFISHITTWDVKTTTKNIRTEAPTKDIQTATIVYTLAYNLNPEKVSRLQREVGKDYYEKLINPVVEGIVKDVIGKQNANELIGNRETVATNIKGKLTDALNSTYFTVTDFNITTITYQDAFMKAVEDKVTAEQEALKAKNKTVQVQEEARQKILTAEADAKAIQLQAQALANNKQIVELEYAKKWDGKLPEFVGGGSIPFINVNKK